MRFRQKPPEQEGLYFAVPEGADEAVQVEITEEGSILCTDPDLYRFPHFVLWYGPLNVPAFKYPKRVLHRPKPVKKPSMPRPCRRWGHKFISCDPPEDLSICYANLIFNVPGFQKCTRCGQNNIVELGAGVSPMVRAYRRTQDLRISDFSTDYFGVLALPEDMDKAGLILDGAGDAKTATEELLRYTKP